MNSCHALWEKEKNIPVDVIKEFEEQATYATVWKNILHPNR